jgi:hypothetical protein
MSENLQVASAVDTLRRSGGITSGQVGRAPPPSIAEAFVEIRRITSVTGLLPFCS